MTSFRICVYYARQTRKFTSYCLSQWISKLRGSFEIQGLKNNTSHEKINGHRELTVSSPWAHGDHGGLGSGAQWSRLSHGQARSQLSHGEVTAQSRSAHGEQSRWPFFFSSQDLLTRSSSGNRLRGLWLQIFIIYSRRSGFSNEFETSLKTVHDFLIVHELIKATFEDLYIFSFNYLLRQVIPDVNDSMRETILPYIKMSPFFENFEGMSPCHAIFPQAYKILACIWVVQYIPRNMHTVLLCFALLWLCNRS